MNKSNEVIESMEDDEMEEITIESARKEAKELIEKEGQEAFILRSCWICNHSHEHLKECSDAIIQCWDCGRYFFKGIDITVEE